MYSVSEAYREAIKRNYRRCSLRGSVETGSGTVIPVSDRNVAEGSVSVSSQCVNRSDFEYGAVYCGELDMSIRTSIDRYSLYGAKIALWFQIETDEGLEEVPLGVYFAEDVQRNGDWAEIKAYDAMSYLDVEVQEDIVGTPYELLSFICEKCGLELAQEEERILELPNGDRLLSIHASRVDKYRDAVAYIAMLLTCFACMDREGKLAVRQFAVDTDVQIGRNIRSKTTISDFRTYYDGMKARFIQDKVYKTYGIAKEMPEGGLTLDLGDVPIVQGLEGAKREILEAMFEVVKEVDYTPYSVDYNGNPAIDLGDMVLIENINGTSEDIRSIVTHIEWNYRNKSTIKAVGGNPKIKAVKENANKQLDNLEASINEKELVIHSYTNASALTVGSSEQTIITFHFATIADTHPVFLATVPLSMDTDGNVAFRYYVDGVQGDVLRQYLPEGDHFLTFMNHFAVEKDKRIMLQVTAATEYQDSAARRQAASIQALENFAGTGTYAPVETDKSVPAAGIARGTIRAVLYAQGMAGAAAWDGTITAAETIGEMPLRALQMAGTAAAPRAAHVPLKRQGISAAVPARELRGLPLPTVSAGASCSTENAG